MKKGQDTYFLCGNINKYVKNCKNVYAISIRTVAV